jgi:hypothetical protein
MIDLYGQFNVPKVSGTGRCGQGTGAADGIRILRGGAQARIVQTTGQGIVRRIKGLGTGNLGDGAIANVLVGIETVNIVKIEVEVEVEKRI